MSAAALVARTTPPRSMEFESPSTEDPPSSSAKSNDAPAAPPDQLAVEGSRTSPTKAHGRDEIRGAYRAQSIRAIREVNGDVDAFIEEVETKRRQLDEQIHRYVKQKEREFKLFERDARIRYRSAGATRSDISGTSPRADSISSSSSVSTTTSPMLQGRTMHPFALAGIDRPRTARDREADLLGVLIPSYIPLINTKGESSNTALPSTSAPAAVEPVQGLTAPEEPALHRANSDPSDDKNTQKQLRFKLEKRNSSSGSESRGLVSALKSSTVPSREPKRKRVSLVVGDEVVAPSDNVAAFESANELARDLDRMDASGSKITDQSNGSDAAQNPERTDTSSESPEPASGAQGGRYGNSHRSAIALAVANAQLARSASAGSSSDMEEIAAAASKESGEVLFGFDDIADQDAGSSSLSVEAAAAADFDDAPDISPVPSPAPAEDVPGSLPMPKLSTMTERPPVQIRTLSSSSSQPISPGFSKPSVTSDSMINFNPDTVTPEIENNADFGSFGASAAFLDRGGSLGESFMERNAQAVRRMGGRRRSSGSGSS